MNFLVHALRDAPPGGATPAPPQRPQGRLLGRPFIV